MSKLDEIIVPETGETRLQNIKNAVSLLRLCKDPGPISVDVETMAEILECADAWREARKWKPTLHYCQDWDFLLIDDNDAEFSACSCYPRFKKGDRVMVTLRDKQLTDYYGFTESKGTVLRLKGNLVRVELDNTGSQDSEGFNAYHDFLREDVKRI